MPLHNHSEKVNSLEDARDRPGYMMHVQTPRVIASRCGELIESLVSLKI